MKYLNIGLRQLSKAISDEKREIIQTKMQQITSNRKITQQTTTTTSLKAPDLRQAYI